MSAKYWFFPILLSPIHVVCSNHEPRLHSNSVEDWCYSLRGLRNVIYGDMCYTLNMEPLTWSAAVRECRAMGGQLFKPDDMVKAAAIGVIGAPTKVWAGASESGGEFYWIDDTPVVGDHWKALENVYTEFKMWFDGTKALCMTLKNRYEFASDEWIYWWKKSVCSHEYSYICEHEINDTLKGVSIPPEVQIKTTPDTTRLLDMSTSSVLVKPTSSSNKAVYKGIKHINMVFSPKLKATPDMLLNNTDEIRCAQACSHDKCCELFNYFPPNTCALYCDKNAAKAKGANFVLGSSIWAEH